MGRLDETTMGDEVFIVDDDYDMREVLSAIIRDAGFRTALFTDGRSFVRLARDQRPACVLLDLHMPGGSGLDILTKLGAKGRLDIVREALRQGAPP